MKRRKKIVEVPRKTFLIVTANEAELLYFSQMRKDCRYTNMSVLWAQEATTVDELIKFAARERIKGKFDRVWALFSFSDYNVEQAEFDEAQKLAAKRNIQLAWTKPALALWYLLHLQSPRAVVDDLRVIEEALKGVLPNFNSSPAYLLKEGASLHLKLFPAKAQAVMNASAYNSLAQQKGAKVVPVNLTKLTSEIADYCGVADMSHNQKMIGLKNA
ncbi:MAG: RloB family protein [Sphaerochaetaceae bacterium]